MNTMVLVAGLFVMIGVTVYFVTVFNGLIALKNDIDKAWSNIDIMLKQRHDELPKLLDVCRAYMTYEQDTLQKIVQARSQYGQASSMDQKAHANQTLTSALRGVFAVAENYPELKANGNFLQIQKRITDLESQIADRREFYNDSVNTFNTRIQQMPDTFVASFVGLKPHQRFKVEEADKAEIPMTFAATR
jgi:LemA protein